jgi:hypothetical protein
MRFLRPFRSRPRRVTLSRMPGRKPAAPDGEPRETRRPGRRAALRADLPPAACVGVLMGIVAVQEGSGGAVAVVVALVGCAAVLGLLALKRGLYGR